MMDDSGMSADEMTHQFYGGSSASERRLWSDVNAWMHMQALQWEPAGQRLLAELGDGTGRRVVDMGCGSLGWLRLLSGWVGPAGEVVGTEATEETAGQARLTVRSEGLSNVSVVVDDVFDSWLPERSFDLVHARFMLGPVGRPDDQMETYRRLVRPGGWLVLEEPDSSRMRFNPGAPANERLSEIAMECLGTLGRDLGVGRQLRTLLRRYGEQPELRAEVLVLPAGHAYMSLALMMVTTFRDRVAPAVGGPELDALLARADEELRDPELWCTTFTLIQGYARIP
jgi:SAM-dependent methyltransferase